MTIKKSLIVFLVPFALALVQNKMKACSMYKITVDGNTMVGCNHDAWLTTPKIWFENAKLQNEFGTVFTGSREVSKSRTTPQSGMNTVGLVFSRLASYYPEQNNPFSDRQKITNEADYLSAILHKCATVKEVKKHIEAYDHSFFLNDVFIYIDSLGDYLIVEPYKFIEGNDPNYVLSNFCPSITDSNQARKIERYRNGEHFLKTHQAMASLDFCTALSDTMSVCRSRNGDGTLITSIFDTKAKMVNLYFYHNFDTLVQYSLTDQLSKGDISINLPEIFPANEEFQTLVNFKTPSNSIVLRIILLLIAGLLALNTFTFILSLFWKNIFSLGLRKTVAAISIFNVILIAYIFVLLTNKSIFYFDVPYKHYSSNLISAFSYTPFILLAVFIPFLIHTRSQLKSFQMRFFKVAMVLNSALYVVLVLGFGYWGLFNFWN